MAQHAVSDVYYVSQYKYATPHQSKHHISDQRVQQRALAGIDVKDYAMCNKSPPSDDGQPLSRTSSRTHINTKHTTKGMTELQPIYRKDLMASICEMILLTDSMTVGKIELEKLSHYVVSILQKHLWIKENCCLTEAWPRASLACAG